MRDLSSGSDCVQIQADEPQMVTPFPDPTPEMLASPEFEAIWHRIKRWDINVPGAYGGYCGAMGNHVRAVLDALTENGFAIVKLESVTAE